MIDISKGRYWDLPWSLVDGCTPCSPGCEHCWAARNAHRFDTEGITKYFVRFPGDAPYFTGKIQAHPERLSIPLKRKKPTVYAVWNDAFHLSVPFEFLDKMHVEISSCGQHKFLILTKRPERMKLYYQGRAHWENEPNIFKGLTVCNQAEANEKIPVFLQVPGKKFLSIEPMLDKIDLRIAAFNGADSFQSLEGIDAVILGGETGPGARPLHPDWVRSIRDQCSAAGVPFFFKQWGEWLPIAGCYEERECPDMPGVIDGDWPLFEVEKYQGRNDIIAMERSGEIPHWERGNQWRIDHQPRLDAAWIVRVGHKASGRLLDGRTHDELPWRKL